MAGINDSRIFMRFCPGFLEIRSEKMNVAADESSRMRELLKMLGGRRRSSR